MRFINSKNVSPVEAMRYLCADFISQGNEIESLDEYHTKPWEFSHWRGRLVNRNENTKKIFPMHINPDGNYVLEEPKFEPGMKPLYNIEDIARSNLGPLMVVEGEPCVKALKSKGLRATTSGAWNSAKHANWSSIIDDEVFIWGDADKEGQQYAHDVATILLQQGCKVHIYDVDAIGMKGKEDCVDWIKVNPDCTAQDILNLPKKICELEDNEPVANSKVAKLLSLVEHDELFHDELKEPYITLNTSLCETFPIRGKQFDEYITKNYWEKFNEGLTSFTKAPAIGILVAKAIFDSKCISVHRRVGMFDGAIYVNLANDNNQCVKITADGWQIEDKSPVKFIKTNNTRSLPIPSTSGNLELLWKYLNIPENDRVLVLAYMLESLRTTTDYPVLVLHGPFNSAKSSTQEFIVLLLDPSKICLKVAPKKQEDIIVAAVNSHMVSFNNMSKLSRVDQDDLCCLATGGGLGTRCLYTNMDEVLVDIKRPVVLNCVNNIITATDLTSRCVIIELPRITQCKQPSLLKSEFMNDYPLILGGLYDIFVEVLRILPEIKIDNLPRMADFALLGSALERVMGYETGEFIKRLNKNQKISMHNSLEGHVVLEKLKQYMMNTLFFKGTYTELLDNLNDMHPKNKGKWPNSGQALAKIIKEYLDVILELGIVINFIPDRSRKGMEIEIKFLPELQEY